MGGWWDRLRDLAIGAALYGAALFFAVAFAVGAVRRICGRDRRR